MKLLGVFLLPVLAVLALPMGAVPTSLSPAAIAPKGLALCGVGVLISLPLAFWAYVWSLHPLVPQPKTPSIKTRYFVAGNVCAAVMMACSLTILHGAWQAAPRVGLLVANPTALAAAISLIASTLYMFAFFGVAFVHDAVASDAESPPASPKHVAARQGVADPSTSPDVIIVGAGTVGASLAATLARQGKSVKLIERSLDIPERIVGELLQPGGVRVLERLGLDGCIQEDVCHSVRVDGYALLQADPTAPHMQLRYPAADPATPAQYLGWTANSSGPANPKGKSFWNHHFVQNLRKAAAAEPLVDFVVGSVRDVVTTKSKAGKAVVTGVVWVDKDGARQETHAPLTVIADGCYSVMRKHLTPAKPFTASFFCGLVLDHPAHESPLPYRNHGHVVLAKPNPVLLYQISPTQTRILVDVPAPMPDEASGELKAYFTDVIQPQLPECLRPTFARAVATQAPMCMGNKGMWTRPPKMDGAILLGDSWNMRHPLTGGGMTVGLKDVEVLARALAGVDVRDAPALAAALAEHRVARKSHSATVNILANALHRVFTVPKGDDGTRQLLRDACFEYLLQGGAPQAGPVGLLSALTPHPAVLVSHFFVVAGFAMKRTLLPLPTPSAVRQAYKVLQAACTIIMPMLEAEQVTMLSSRPALALTNAVFGWRRRSCA